MKKIISVLAALVISVMSLSAFAVNAEPELQTPVDEDIELYYMYATAIQSLISVSGKNITATSSVTASSGVTKIIITQTLQQKVSGAWSEPYPSKIKTVYSTTGSYTNTYSNRNAGTYRIKTVATVYKGSSYEKTDPTYSAARTIS